MVNLADARPFTTADQQAHGNGVSYTTRGVPNGGQAPVRGGGQTFTATGMDFERGDRQQEAQEYYWAGDLKERTAARKAQDAYNMKRLELERMGFGLQADQLAKQYAMDQARLAWEKESFREQFGQTVKQQDIDNKFRDQESALDNQWRTAEQTGFRDGAPTLARMQFNEQTRQFDVGQSNNQRDFGEATRQFNVGAGQFSQTFGEGQRQFNQTFGEGQRQFNADATGYVGVPGQLTAEQSARYNQIMARDAEVKAAGGSGVDARDQAELQGYRSILDGTASGQRQATLERDQFSEDTRRYDQDFGEDVRRNDRNYGEDVRRYDQDFGEAQFQDRRNFGEDVRRNDRDYGEDVRRYDQDFGEDTRRYDQDFGEGRRQFNVSTVMNAPRGPADWAAYQRRMRGLQSAGSMFGSSQPVASYSNGGQQTGPVLSNTDLALTMTGQGNPSQLQGTPWQGMASPSGGGTSSPYGGGSNASGGGSSSPYGDSSGSNASAMSLPSIQRYRKFSPTEQAMGLGEIEENGGPTAEDSQYLMQRQAPNMERSRTARMAGI
jgi:hypothetical protein